MHARIDSCKGFPGELQEIVLNVSAEFAFRAGQYLEIELADDDRIPLSIASSPHRLPQLHLHYRSTPGLAEARLFNELLTEGGALAIHGPFGTACLPTPLRAPLLIIAGGTGGGQALGLLDALLAKPPPQPVSLLWCADRSEELYRRGWLESLDREWLTSKCIADARRDVTNRGLVWLRDRAPTLANHHIILSGSPGFVYSAVDVLLPAGVLLEQMASDVLAYAPRA
jgi:CDP-4-dehydro-6-deoxyglucose reductase